MRIAACALGALAMLVCLSAAADEVTTHRGRAKTQNDACSVAQQLASADGGEASACECEQQGNGFSCTANSTLTRGVTVVTFQPVKPAARIAPQPPRVRPPQCMALIEYRDTALRADLDKALRRNTAAQKSLDILRPLAVEVSRAKLLHPTVDLAHRLVLTLKTSSDLIADLFDMVPGMGEAKSAATGFAAAVLSQEAELGGAMLTNELDSYVATQAMMLVPTIGPALKASRNFVQNQTETANNEAESRETIASIDRQVTRLEQLLKQQQSLLRSAQTQATLINQIKNDIDRACR